MPTLDFRGREPEIKRLTSLLDAAGISGRGGVALIEGPTGVGKSQLVGYMARIALERGFQVVEVGLRDQPDPLVPLLAVLGHPAGSVAADLRDVSRHSLLDQLRKGLKDRLAQGPLLIVLDDVSWNDPLVQHVLGVLPVQLAGCPVVFLLTRNPEPGTPSADRLIKSLKDSCGAVQVRLGPLAGDVVAVIAQDFLGAEPDEQLRVLMECADGNPLVLVELLRDLVDECAVRLDGGKARLGAGFVRPRTPWATADLADPRLPEALCKLIYRRLDALSTQAREVLDVASILGHSFTPDDVAEMLAKPVAALLPAFKEAFLVGVLVPARVGAAFRHDPIREVLRQSIPHPIRAALHRQAAALLLERGAPVAMRAIHLAHGAARGDRHAAEILRQAAQEAIANCPWTAAELALRGLDLLTPDDPGWLPLTSLVVEACVRAGPITRAIELAKDTLARPLPAPAAADLRYWLSTALLLRGECADAMRIAESLFADPGILSGQAKNVAVNHIYGLSSQDETDAGPRIEQTLAEIEHRGWDLRAGALIASTHSLWRQGRIVEVLALCREGVWHAERGSAFTLITHPWLALAAALTQLRELVDARILIDELQRDVDFVLSGVLRIMCAQVELAEGRLDHALTEATAGMEICEDVQALLYLPVAWGIAATVALCKGDLETATRETERLRRAYRTGRHEFSALCGWMRAQIAAARGDSEMCLQALAEISHNETTRVLFAVEPAAAAWIVRTATEAGRPDWVHTAVATMDRVAADNAEAPSVAAAAAHARGLRDRDPMLLAQAVTGHRDVWARASAIEDLAVTLADGDRESAVRCFNQALTIYGDMGAGRDAARVRNRLRGLGVQSRYWKQRRRPATGLDSLTNAERTVARLVAEGLTNRQVGSQLFLSPHTIAFHLRQVFRKLDIRSRVELARLYPGSEAG